MDLALSNLQKLISHKTQATKQLFFCAYSGSWFWLRDENYAILEREVSLQVFFAIFILGL